MKQKLARSCNFALGTGVGLLVSATPAAAAQTFSGPATQVIICPIKYGNNSCTFKANITVNGLYARIDEFLPETFTPTVNEFNGVDIPFVGTSDGNNRYLLSDYLTSIGNYTFLLKGFSTSKGKGNIIGSLYVMGASTPEPDTWALMIIGFGFVGAAIRRHARPSLDVTYA